MKIKIVISGRGYPSAQHVPSELEVAEGATLDEVISMISQQLLADASLPSSCLVAVGGQHVGTLGNHNNQPLVAGDEVTLIAPVAGGRRPTMYGSVIRLHQRYSAESRHASLDSPNQPKPSI